MTLLLVASAAVLFGSIAIAAALPPRGAFAFLLAVALVSWAVVNTIVSVAGVVLRDLSPATLDQRTPGLSSAAIAANASGSSSKNRSPSM